MVLLGLQLNMVLIIVVGNFAIGFVIEFLIVFIWVVISVLMFENNFNL